jgi:hypothetical protein
MIERVLVPSAATILSLVFFVAGLIAVALILFGTAMPCSPESVFYDVTRIAAVIALFAGAVLMERLKFAPSAVSRAAQKSATGRSKSRPVWRTPGGVA